MEQITIGNSSLTTSRVGLGTWAIGGWMWGGTDEARSIATIRSVVERGVIICERLLSQRPRPLSRFENRRMAHVHAARCSRDSKLATFGQVTRTK